MYNLNKNIDKQSQLEMILDLAANNTNLTEKSIGCKLDNMKNILEGLSVNCDFVTTDSSFKLIQVYDELGKEFAEVYIQNDVLVYDIQ